MVFINSFQISAHIIDFIIHCLKNSFHLHNAFKSGKETIHKTLELTQIYLIWKTWSPKCPNPPPWNFLWSKFNPCYLWPFLPFLFLLLCFDFFFLPMSLFLLWRKKYQGISLEESKSIISCNGIDYFVCYRSNEYAMPSS